MFVFYFAAHFYLLAERRHGSDRVAEAELFFFLFGCLKNAIVVSDCLKDKQLVKNGSIINFSDHGEKESAIICAHIRSLLK